MAPSCRRWFWATCLIRLLKVLVRNQKSGNTATAITAKRQFIQNINPIIPITTNALASIGRRAVTATSCNMPTSPINRTTRSPVLAWVWNESERY